MQQRSWWVIPAAVLGSGGVVAVTLLLYVQAYRLGAPGGYLPLVWGAGGVGLIAGVANFLLSPAPRPALITFLAVTLVTALLLAATLIWAFGS
jgi:hypothetical protein